MYKIEYNIGLNEHGRPYIDLPDDYEQRPEDRFFAIEIVRYILQDLLKRKTSSLDENTINHLEESTNLLGQLGDSIAEILYKSMREQGKFAINSDSRYHIKVNSLEERDNLPEKDIIYKDKVFDRVEGLKVMIITYNPSLYSPEYNRYELINGITNENWVKL